MIRFAYIKIPVDLPAIKKEIMQLPSTWQPHLNVLHYTGDWSVLSLRSPGGNENNAVADLLHSVSFEDTPLMKQCPSVKKLLDALGCPIMSVRLLNLKRGSYIKPHKDAELCYEQGEARLHIPIITNEQVSFYSEDELIPMKEGECWYINANLKHSVANAGNSDRIHLVIDCKVNAPLTELFENAERTEIPDRDVLDTVNTQNIIEELKRQNTPTTLQLANSLEEKLSRQV